MVPQSVWYHKLPPARVFSVCYQPDEATCCVGSNVYVWNVFGYFPPPLTQYGASVSLSILFRSIQDLNSVERKERDVMALLSMFGESLHLCTVQTEMAKHFGPSSTSTVIGIKCTYITYVSTHFPACVQNHSRFRKVYRPLVSGSSKTLWWREAFSDRTLDKCKHWAVK